MIKETAKISYQEGYEQVKAEVDRILSTSPFIIREYMKHLSLSTGKFVRTQALLIAAMDENDKIHPDGVKLAASIELIHLATLVHDDIIDNAEIRRGELSLHKKYGKRTAVICGDYLLAVAMKLAADTTQIESYVNRDIPDYLSRVCLGELSQHIHNGNYSLSPYRYLKIIAGKTAALFEGAYHGGALLCCGENDKLMKQYAKLGKYVGMIFQLTDDCMDFEATEQTAKKPVKSDFDQNVVTLPLIYALRKVKGLKKQAEAGLLTRDMIDQAVEESGGIEYTRKIALKYYNKSLKIIDTLIISDNKREKLLDIVNKAYRVF